MEIAPGSSVPIKSWKRLPERRQSWYFRESWRKEAISISISISTFISPNVTGFHVLYSYVRSSCIMQHVRMLLDAQNEIIQQHFMHSSRLLAVVVLVAVSMHIMSWKGVQQCVASHLNKKSTWSTSQQTAVCLHAPCKSARRKAHTY